MVLFPTCLDWGLDLDCQVAGISTSVYPAESKSTAKQSSMCSWLGAVGFDLRPVLNYLRCCGSPCRQPLSAPSPPPQTSQSTHPHLHRVPRCSFRHFLNFTHLIDLPFFPVHHNFSFNCSRILSPQSRFCTEAECECILQQRV